MIVEARRCDPVGAKRNTCKYNPRGNRNTGVGMLERELRNKITKQKFDVGSIHGGAIQGYFLLYLNGKRDWETFSCDYTASPLGPVYMEGGCPG